MEQKERFNYYVNIIDEKLNNYFSDKFAPQANLFEAMRYSLLAGGKRIRPMLVLEFCRICGGDIEKALPFACAVEIVHTYSLIHDDLPCMDNDDFRRGRLTNHKVFGDAVAVLAGDALLTAAFEIMLDNARAKEIEPEKIIAAAFTLSKAIGEYGMLGGQILDIEAEGKSLKIDEVEMIHNLKTSALITAAAKIGCIIAGGSEYQQEKAEGYAKSIGLAFQIRDDMLDYEGDAEIIGKPIKSDEINKKSTFVSLFGLEKSRDLVFEHTKNAKNILTDIFLDNSFLEWLSDVLANREK